MLPRRDGLEVCRWIRSRSEVPVIMLTARADEADRIVGLELGADDYVTKPFSPRELAARVKTVLRRTREPQRRDTRLVHGGLVIDAATREVTKDGLPLRLTAKEFDLLFFLASMVLLIISVHHSYELGRLEDRTRTLAEEVALLRLQVESAGAAEDLPQPSHPDRG